MNPLHSRNVIRAAGRRLGGAVVVSLALVTGLALGQATRPQQIGAPKPQPIGQPAQPAPTPPAPVRPAPPTPPRATPPVPPRATPPAPAPTRPVVTPAPTPRQPAAPRATPPAAPRATPPAPSQPARPAVTPRTNPPVQDGTRLAGPAGFGPDGFTSAALPLVSVGRAVGWRIPPDDFRVFVPQAAGGRSIALEVFSPEVNRNDYANQRDRRTYYGDELYGKTATLATTFNFKNAQGGTLVNRTFGESLRHSFERLTQQNLAPGFYPLTVTSEGNGKNSFALRVTNGARIESSQFTVTARGSFNQDQVVGFVQIDPSQLGKTVKLENYDADGPTEIVLTLVGPDGKRYPLTASGDTQWATNTFVVNRALVGTWKIVARILPTTRQFSNSFAVRLRVDDQPLYAQLPGFGIRTQPLLPIRCEVVDTTGAAIPGATCTTTGAATRTLRPNLPECYSPVSATILEGTGAVVSPTQVNISSQSGAVRFVATCPPARVQVNAVALVCGARTPVPAAGFSVSGTPAVTATAPRTVDVQPGRVTITPGAIPGSTAQPVTVTAVRGQTVVATLEYTVQTELSLTPGALNLEVGQSATLVARATTAFPSAIPAQINLTLPAGLETSAPLRVAGTISNGKPLILTVPVRAVTPVSNATARATLEPNCGVQATTTVTVSAPPPPPTPPTPPPPAPPPPTPPAPDPAKLTLTKTVDRELVKPGERPVYTLTVTNTGGTVARNVTLTDTLPVGLRGERVAQTFDLEPGASKVVTVDATVNDDAVGTLTNTARVTWSGDPLQATAQVRVQPVVDLAVTKSVTPTSLQVGEGATYTMVVTNNGPSTATNVTLSDPLPTGLTYVSSSTSQGTASFANNTITANLGTLARGARATVTVRVTAPNVGRYTNTAVVSATETETTLDNNRASAVLEVRAAPPPPPTPLGTLQVTSSAVVCGAPSALSSTGFTVNGQRYTAPATVQLAPGTYTVQPEAVPGSTAQPVTVTVASNQTATANLAYAVQLALTLEPESNSLRTGETRTLTATASTAFPYPVATGITYTVPAPLTLIRGALTTTGTVRAGQPLVSVITVRGLENASAVVVRASLPASCNISDSTTLSITPTALPEQRRESQVVLLAKIAQLPVLGNALILSDRIPQGATYVRGSSRLVTNPSFDVNTPTSAPGTPIADPYANGDRLFWVLPLRQGETNTARALREAAARGQITMTRNAQGQTVYGITYRLAHSGALVMPEDRVAAIVAVPARRSPDRDPSTAINPDSALGKLIGAGDLLVVQGSPEILSSLQAALPFSGPLEGAGSASAIVGGSATTVRVSVQRATTDAVDEPVIVVEAFDANGLPASDAFATLEANVDLISPDAQPEVPGFQVKLEGGVGRVRIENLVGGTASGNQNPISQVKVEARISNANGVISSSQTFNLSDFNALLPAATNTTAVSRPIVAAGTLGIGGALDFNNGAFSVNGGLRFFLRGEIAQNLLLTLGINWQADWNVTNGNLALSGTLMPPANPFERFPLLGDSSVLGSDVRSTEGFYIRLESGPSYAMFGQFNPNFQGVLIGYSANYNGFQGVLRSDGFGINTFITDAPNADQRLRLRADGSDLYFLPTGGIAENSERIVIATYSRLTNQKLSTRTLNRGADYSIDYTTGIIRLRQAVLSTDNDLNPVFVEVDFASVTAGRDLRAGAQASLGDEGFKFTATALQFRNGQFGGNSSFVFGAGVSLNSGGFSANLEGALSGPFGNQGLGLAAQAAHTAPGFQFGVDYRDRDPNFVNPESNQPDRGRALTAGLTIGDPNGFRINGALLHNQDYVNGNGTTGASAEARLNLGGDFTVGLGLQYLYSFPVSSNELWLTGGVALGLGGVRLTLDGRAVLAGTPTTYGGITAGIEVPLSDTFSLRLQDKLTFEAAGLRQQVSFGVKGAFSNAEILRSAFGNEPVNPDAFGITNVTAAYELDTLDGNAGRARVGVETTVPLGSNFSAQLGGEAVFEPAGNFTGSASLGLLYANDDFKGSARAQFSFQPSGVKQVYTLSAIAPLSNEFIISPLIEYAVDPSRWNTPGASSADGGRYSIAFALRSDDWSILSNNTGKFGLYAPNGDFLEGEVQAGYQASERLYFRSGIAYRYQFTGGVFTGQLGLGIQYFLTDGFAVGAQGGYLFNTLGASRFAFGVEGSLRVVNNLLFTLGVNALGFNGIGSQFNPGLYFRLDWKIDERTFGIRP